jgi:hypothetical protein
LPGIFSSFEPEAPAGVREVLCGSDAFFKMHGKQRSFDASLKGVFSTHSAIGPVEARAMEQDLLQTLVDQ